MAGGTAIEAPTLDALNHIAANMRACDAAEIFPMRWDDDPASLAESLMAGASGLMDIVTLDGEPVTALGAVPMWPGVWNVFAFGTDKWDKAIVTASKRILRFTIPAVYNAGAHRAQCWSIEGHGTAHAWLVRTLRARQGPLIEALGRGGQDYRLFWWDRATVEAARMVERADHVRRRWGQG